MKKHYILINIFIYKLGSGKLHFHYSWNFIPYWDLQLYRNRLSHFMEEEIEALRDLRDLSKITQQASARLERVPEPSTCPSSPGTFYVRRKRTSGHCPELPGYRTFCTTVQFRFAECALSQWLSCVEAIKKLNTWNF